MGKDQEAPVVITPPKKSGPNPAIWVILLLVIAFPASVMAAAPLLLASRKGFARANMLYLTVLFAVATGVAYLVDDDAIVGYKDAYFALIDMTGLISLEAPSPNFPIFVTAGLAVGSLLAAIITFVWRAAHKDDEDWLEAHPEKPDWLGGLFVKSRNAKIAAANEKVIEKIADGDWFGDHEVGLGYALDSVEPGRKIEPVGLPDLVGGSVNHSLILGSSGRGKTQTITRQAFDAIKKGDPVLVVDAKGDGDLAAKLGAYAEEFGRPFYHFAIPHSTSAPYAGPSENGRAFYDPAGLSAGNHTRRRDFMMNARDWKGAPAVYSDKTRDWLSRALWVDNVVAEVNGGKPLDSAPKATFARVADLMSPMTARHYLREAANIYGVDAINKAFGTTTFDAMMAEMEQYATTTDQTGESARMSHAAWLRTFMSSITGPYLLNTGDDRTIDIARIVEEQAVCIFDLATDQYREEAPALARLVVADLLSYISTVGKADGLRLRVFLDEFAAVGGDESANVLARARSAGVSFTLSTQTLSDLRDVSEAFEGQVLTNALNLLIHNASTWDEAERLAGMTGQIESQRVTRSERMDMGPDGARTKSISSEKRYRVEPSEFMEMGVGELVKISQVERGSGKAVKIRVVMPPKVDGSVFTVEGYAPLPQQFFELDEETPDSGHSIPDATDTPAPEDVAPATHSADEEEVVSVFEAIPTDETEGKVEPAQEQGDIEDEYMSVFDVSAGSEAEKPTPDPEPESAAVDDSEGEWAEVYVTETEEERRARIAALADDNSLFDVPVRPEPGAGTVPVAETVTVDPPPDEDKPVRPVRRIRR